MNKDKIIIEFKDYLMKKGFTKSSVDGYIFALIGFLNYLKNNQLGFYEFSNKDILNYKKSLDCSPQTINVKLAAIKKYCVYLKDAINFNIDYDVPAVKTFTKKSIEVIDNFNNILENIEMIQKDASIILRDKLIFSLLYYLGIRASELVKIKRKDVNSGHLFINDKKIIINKLLFKDIDNYINKLGLEDDEYLFFSHSHGNKKNKIDKNLTVKSVEDLFNKYTKFLNKKYSINDLRNSYKFNSKNTMNIDMINNHSETNWPGYCLSFLCKGA